MVFKIYFFAFYYLNLEINSPDIFKKYASEIFALYLAAFFDSSEFKRFNWALLNSIDDTCPTLYLSKFLSKLFLLVSKFWFWASKIKRLLRWLWKAFFNSFLSVRVIFSLLSLKFSWLIDAFLFAIIFFPPLKISHLIFIPAENPSEILLL